MSLRALAIFLALSSLQIGAGHTRPNVIILFTDDQGTLDANCYGSTALITPNIDKLAASGVRFTQAYAHTVCCPSRAALLTGRHPQRGGVTDWTQGQMGGAKGINMALAEVTLAEALKAAGYRTGLFGKWHLGAHRDHGPEQQGFDDFFGIRGGFIDNYNHHFLHGNGFHDLYEGTTEVFAPGEYFPELIVSKSLDFIDENRDKPFFLYLALNLPHYPEQALAKFDELYASLEDPALRSYAAMISTTDHYIGRVVDKLDELGLRKDTVIVFMSDNGHSEETFMRIRGDKHTSGLPKGHLYAASGAGNTGKWIGHKATFLEGGIRVPAIISYPGRLPQGKVRDQMMTVMDWFPTVMELCGIKRESGAAALDGHSLLPLIESAAAPSPYGGVLHFAWRGDWAVRDGDWKLISMTPGGLDEPVLSLHNLTGENPEAVDHLKAEPETVARLRALHEAWHKEVSPKK
ncbi:sulfatase-like hydrolase/transferase [Akkermansiaceae bacterium]|nr:sulfatase-like hydrolase/transferase [Akkermansiaceae bacterium]